MEVRLIQHHNNYIHGDTALFSDGLAVQPRTVRIQYRLQCLSQDSHNLSRNYNGQVERKEVSQSEISLDVLAIMI